MRRQKTLPERIEARIAHKGGDAFLTREFADLGGEDQVLRALRPDTGRTARALRLRRYARDRLPPFGQADPL